jgi:uncharacterized membrane protein YkvA (DUF1232 family)
MPFIARLKSAAANLKREVIVLYLVIHDRRTPWYAKAFVACVVAYALSPIDLIPDPIPILGYLDDLILIPLGISLALKMIPESIIVECRRKALLEAPRMPRSWTAAAVIVLLWIGTIVAMVIWVRRSMNG